MGIVEYGGRLKIHHINASAAYGVAMAGIPSEIAYGDCKEIHHAILPWLPFNNTALDRVRNIVIK